MPGTARTVPGPSRTDDTAPDGAMKAAIGAREKYGVDIHDKRVPGLLIEHDITRIATMNPPWEGMAPPKFG